MLEVRISKELRDFRMTADLSVNPGEILVLIGENGAGKSSLLYAISGLITPDAGAIRLGSRLLFDSSSGIDLPVEERNIGQVFQNYAVFPHMTVFENVAYGLRRRKIPSRELHERVREKLEFFSLDSFSGIHAARLSGGQRQRVALSRALVIQPSLLLLDEPVSAIDAGTKDRFREELRSSIRDAGIPCIMVTHSFCDALSLGDRIGLMDHGTIIRTGTSHEMMDAKSEFLTQFFCGCRNEGIFSHDSQVINSVENR